MLLDLTLTGIPLVGDVKVGHSLGYSDHENVDFSTRGGASRAASKMVTTDFRRANFSLFGDLLGRIPQEQPL